MKLKFFLLTFLLLFARGCDFYSTSLWFFDNPTGETNPFYWFFGVGWTGLIIANIVIVGLIIYAFYYYSFKYRTTKIKSSSNNLTDFVSELYFNEKGRFLEIYVQADLETCKKRDPKGLYEKALAGKIPEFTGVSDPYEVPEHPELAIDTTSLGIEEALQQILHRLELEGYLRE